MFFDGNCPLCRREIDWIRRRDRVNSVEFVDIASSEYEPTRWGKSYQDLMSEIHGVSADGQWITGVEVFRELYSAAGFEWLVAPTRLPLVRHLLSWGYRAFARHRVRLTGRSDENY